VYSGFSLFFPPEVRKRERESQGEGHTEGFLGGGSGSFREGNGEGNMAAKHSSSWQIALRKRCKGKG